MKRTFLSKVLIVFVLAFLSIGSAWSQIIIYVNDDAQGLNDGTSWENALTDLQSALLIAQVFPDIEIWVAQGIYKPTTGTDRTASFVMAPLVPIYGGFAGNETSRDQRDWITNLTILSGDIGITENNADNSYHVVRGNHLATLDGFTVTRGRANGNDEYSRGGGMYNFYCSPTVTNCTFYDNNGLGSGMYNEGSSPIVTNCIFRNIILPNNVYNIGCGMCNWPLIDWPIYEPSSPIVTGCTFICNSGGFGGGMENESDCKPTIINCIFSSNRAINGGGGIYNWSSSPTVTGCCFNGNYTAVNRNGGGMFNHLSSPTITNCIFSGNISQNNGGGIYNEMNSRPTVINCTFSGNSAITSGGGMYNQDNPIVTNCIFWDNSAPNGPQIYGGDPIITYSDIQGGWPGQGNINIDPLFADTINSDYQLKSQAGRWVPNIQSWVLDDVTSRCIDAGNPGCPLGSESNDANNLRINMGAFGGMSQASKTPANWSLLADLTNDGIVDFIDFSYLADNLLTTGQCLPGDLSRDTVIDFSDILLFVNDWQKETIWHK